MNNNSVTQLPTGHPGSGAPAGNGSGNGSGFESRLSKLETHIQYLATKEDIQKLSTQIAERESSLQRWLIGVLLTAIVSLSLALIRLFF